MNLSGSMAGGGSRQSQVGIAERVDEWTGTLPGVTRPGPLKRKKESKKNFAAQLASSLRARATFQDDGLSHGVFGPEDGTQNQFMVSCALWLSTTNTEVIRSLLAGMTPTPTP